MKEDEMDSACGMNDRVVYILLLAKHEDNNLP
jgi:hypothetical protein